MDIVFRPPDSRTGMPGELMSSVSKPITSQLMSVSAANADQLGESRPVETRSIEATGGWDAYEVWRRFIKDARDRRRSQDSN